MPQVLTTDMLKRISALTERLELLGVEDIIIDDPDIGLLKVSITNLKKTLVPYSGAIGDVTLGVHNFTAALLYAGGVNLNTTTPATGTTVGQMRWNVDEFVAEVVLPNGVVLQVGEELLVTCKKKTGIATIPNGTVIRFSNTLGVSGKLVIAPAVGGTAYLNPLTPEYKPRYVLGVTTEEIIDEGKVCTFGKVRGLDTTGTPYGEVWAQNDILWLSPTIVGGFTNVKPSAPNLRIPLGFVVSVHAVMGTILVRPYVGNELEDLHNVASNGDRVDGAMLEFYDAGDYWRPSNRINILEGTVDTAGSVLKSIKDNAKDADILDTPEQFIATTIEGALAELASAVALKEPAANKTTVWSETPSDVRFPSEKLVDTRFASIESVIGHIFATDYRVSDGVCTRALDSIGKTFAVHAGAYDSSLVNDFDNYAPWKDIKQIKTDANGTLLAIFGDGVYDTLTTAEMYTRYSEYWLSIKPITINSVAYVRWAVSDVPRTGFFKAPMFDNGDGTYNKYVYLGRGQASEEGGALVTKPHLAHSRSRTPPTYLSMAAAKGDGGWGLYDYATMMSIYALMVVEAGKMDVKSAYGQGIQSGMPYSSSIVCTLAQTGANSIIIATAQTTNFSVGMMAQIGTAYTSQDISANRNITLIEDLGDGNTRITVDGVAFNTALGNTIACWDQPVPLAQIDALHGGSGYITQFNSVYRSHVCYRGAWDLWGNMWQFVAGFYRKDMAVYVCYDPSKYTVTDPTLDAAWLYLGTPNLANGYQKTWTFMDTPYGMAGYPSATGGGAGSGTFYAAYLCYFNSDYMGVRVLLSGGSWSDGGYVSPLYWNGYFTLSSSYIYVGARLIRRVAA